MLKDSIEKQVVPELTDILLGRNLCARIFRFPNGAWSYTYMKRGYTRATVVTEFSAPPIVHPRVRKFGMEYHEIATAVGISDRMLRFQDFPTMEWNIEAGGRAMALKQDRDIINAIIASVPFYFDGSTNLFMRLQNADAQPDQEWRTFTLFDEESNKCRKGRSHVIVGNKDNAGVTPEGGNNDALILETINHAMELVEEHYDGMINMCLINPRQKTDFRNFVDFTKAHTSNPPSIAPPQFNGMMTKGWVGEWMGINFISTHAMTPGTMLFLDTSKVCVLGEYGAPFIESGIREQWQGWTAQMWRQYYQPACPDPDYMVLAINLTGDNDYGGTPTDAIDHTVQSEVDAQYTKLPLEEFEIAGVPG
jgi:hypothetical protein